jgi:hypothetical protein
MPDMRSNTSAQKQKHGRAREPWTITCNLNALESEMSGDRVIAKLFAQTNFVYKGKGVEEM